MPLIDRSQMEQVARLARIALPEDQLEQLAQQLSQILEYVGQLQAVEIPEGIEPFFGMDASANAARPDCSRPGIEREQALRNAPDSDGQFYLVPPVFK